MRYDVVDKKKTQKPEETNEIDRCVYTVKIIFRRKKKKRNGNRFCNILLITFIVNSIDRRIKMHFTHRCIGCGKGEKRDVV